MTEPAPRALDVRVGSATDGLAPISGAERSLAATAVQWISLGAIALSALGGDQLTKYFASTRLALDEQVHVAGPLSIHHVHNSGIAFGFFSNATAIVTALTAMAVGWMLLFFARSGARAGCLSAARSHH